MRLKSRKVFLVTALTLVSSVFAANHHLLNGTWILDPVRSDFHGQPMIQTGSVTIFDRQGNLSVERNFTYQGANGSSWYSFSIDGPEGSTIHQGKTIKSRAKWEGDVLRVNTVENGASTVERFSLTPDDSLMLIVERPGLPAMTLFFHRQ